MKKLIYALATVLALSAVSCGNDEPEMDRNRDFDFTVFELFHISGTTPRAAVHSCDITIHRKALTADFVVRASANEGVIPFTLKDVPLIYDADKNIYTTSLATTGEPRVTQFVARVDCNDYIADINFVIDGTVQVRGTSNAIIYSKSESRMTFDDNTTAEDPYATYMFTIQPDGNSARLTITNLTHKKDVLNYKSIDLEGLQLTVTDGGYQLAADNLQTEKGEYSRFDYSTGAPTTPFGDNLFLRFENLSARLDLSGTSMTGSWTMVRLRRVTDTIQTVPEIRTEQRVVEVNRTAMTVTGQAYQSASPR